MGAFARPGLVIHPTIAAHDNDYLYQMSGIGSFCMRTEQEPAKGRLATIDIPMRIRRRIQDG
jgi:hypothetical protein